MKRKLKSIGLLAMSLTTGLALMGTTVGSLAWYAYSSTAAFSFIGTSVKKSVLLSIGLVDDNRLIPQDMLNQYGMVRESHDGHSIIFTNSSQGLKVDVIKEFLNKSNYAYNKLFPVTTNERDLVDTSEFKLYSSPEHGETLFNEEADTDNYVKLPFAFRIFDSDESVVSDKPVWLTDAVAETAEENIHQAIRIYIENDETTFLMKPADNTNMNGTTLVAGQLDLDGDGTYDYDDEDNNKEFYYGRYTGTVSHSATPYGVDPDLAPLDDVNDTGATERSTFLAKHNKFARVADTSGATPLEAKYYTTKYVKPKVDSTGNYYADATQGMPICSTSSASGIGYATFTIFIEGWDHAVIDRAAGHSFNLGLTFEINKQKQ